VFFDHTGTSPFYEWPDYTSSWEHAGRVLEALEYAEPLFLLDAEFGKGKMKEICDSADLKVRNIVEESSLKNTIAKFAAKCVLNGIELEGDNE